LRLGVRCGGGAQIGLGAIQEPFDALDNLFLDLRGGIGQLLDRLAHLAIELLHHLVELFGIGVAAFSEGVDLGNPAFDAGCGEIGALVGIGGEGDPRLFRGEFPGVKIIAGEAARGCLVHRIERKEEDQQGGKGHRSHTQGATAREPVGQRAEGVLQALPERFGAGVGDPGKLLDLAASRGKPLLERWRHRTDRLLPNGGGRSEHWLKGSPMLRMGAQDLFDAGAGSELLESLIKKV
jgi:hypothetical protein